MKKNIIENTQITSKSINEAALHFLKPLSLQQTYATIVHTAIELFKGKGAFIILKDKDYFQTVYSSMHFKKPVKPRKKGFIYTSITNNRVMLIHVNEFQKIHPEITGVASSLFIPLSYEGNTIGVLLVHFEKKVSIKEEDFALLKLFGSLISLAIKNAHFHAEMKKAVETRDLFIAMASHELKTPLTSINIYSQLLKKRLKFITPSETKWIDQLIMESNRLTLLTNELLQVDQIKTGAFQYQIHNCDLTDVIKVAVTNVSFMYPHTHFTFENNIKGKHAYTMGDVNKLLQVLLNVLSNAAKFSPDKEKVTIALTNGENTYKVSVSDKGKGIPNAELKKIFHRFYKGSNNYKEGMGLGLFLTKKIIEDHNGNISVTSQLGEGTKFQIILPKSTYV